jgi:hypothetical protein
MIGMLIIGLNKIWLVPIGLNGSSNFFERVKVTVHVLFAMYSFFHVKLVLKVFAKNVILANWISSSSSRLNHVNGGHLRIRSYNHLARWDI